MYIWPLEFGTISNNLTSTLSLIPTWLTYQQQYSADSHQPIALRILNMLSMGRRLTITESGVESANLVVESATNLVKISVWVWGFRTRSLITGGGGGGEVASEAMLKDGGRGDKKKSGIVLTRELEVLAILKGEGVQKVTTIRLDHITNTKHVKFGPSDD